MIPHDRRPWYEPYHRLAKALIELSAHLFDGWPPSWAE